MGLLGILHQMVWGPWTLAVFIGVGLYYSARTGLFQIRGFGFWWRQTAGSLGKEEEGDEKKGISQFQSVCTALAATVGTGNIAGVATALSAGGPGALFWMWVSALIGMITAYGETFLGIKSRYRGTDGHYVCGPFVYMERLLGIRWLGVAYSLLCILCSLGMGSMVQSNSAVSTMSYSWGVPAAAGGAALTVLVAAVIWGGIGRIGAVAERLVPAASGIYILFSLLVILSCADRLPSAVFSVFYCALTPGAALGGAAGYGISQSIRYGMARGVFSNEAGLGTLAVLHGAARAFAPEKQGMWAMFEVFFDTVVLCTLTGLVILCMTDSMRLPIPYEGAALASWCFQGRLGALGSGMISVSMAVFAFATMIAWFYLGRQAASYAADSLGRGRAFADRFYPLLFLGAVFLGSVGRLETVWALSDIFNGLMAFPNLTALIFLAGQVRVPAWKGGGRG